MNIGEAAKSSGVSTKMIRHYESIELIQQSHRSEAGYRIFNSDDLHALKFIKRARSLGFSLEQIRGLLKLWQDNDRASEDVKHIALLHVADLDKRITELTEMRDTLKHLARSCAGDHRHICPILHSLANVKASGPDQSGNQVQC